MGWSPRLIAALQRGGAPDNELRRVLTRFTPRDYLAATDDDLRAAGCRRTTPVDGPEPDAALITCTAPEWPEWAETAMHQPAVLWHNGTIPKHPTGIAIVGAERNGSGAGRVETAAIAGAQQAHVPVWTTSVTAGNTQEIERHLVVTGPQFDHAAATASGMVCTPHLPGPQRTPDGHAAEMTEGLCIAAATIVCVVAGTARTATSRAVWDAFQNGKTVIVPALAQPVAGFELPYLFGTSDWFDRRRLGVPDKGKMFDHVTPLAHAVCRNADDLTETVRVAAVLTRGTCNPAR